MSLLGAVGSSLGGAAGSAGQSLLDNYFARSNAKQAYERQTRFAQNAHQWEVADLKKAGLNPILSAGGGGAHAPSVAMAAVPKTQNLFEAGQAGLHSARSNQILAATLEKAKAEASVARYEAEKADAKRANRPWFNADVLKDISSGTGQLLDKGINAILPTVNNKVVQPVKSLFSSGASKWAVEEAKNYYTHGLKETANRIKRLKHVYETRKAVESGKWIPFVPGSQYGNNW